MPRKCPTLFSVFTGAGGLDIGLEAAGFKVVACIEVDDVARKTILANRPKWNLLPGDLAANRDIMPRAFGLRRRQLSVLAGAPPCQPFSKAAQWSNTARAGLDDDRSECIRLFFGLVERFLPRVVLIENVPGFIDSTCDA